MSVFRHIVLFRIHDGVPDVRVDETIVRLRMLGTLPGIVRWRIERSRDTRKGRVVVEDAAFTDEAAFEAFLTHPAHLAAGELMSEISDWWIGDDAD